MLFRSLGVSRIVPVLTRRCISRPDEQEFARKKLPRLNKIAEEAAKQSGRGIIPEVAPMVSYKEALEMMKKLDRNVLLYEEEEGGRSFGEIDFAAAKTVGLLIGSEGGFDKEEAAAAKQKLKEEAAALKAAEKEALAAEKEALREAEKKRKAVEKAAAAATSSVMRSVSTNIVNSVLGGKTTSAKTIAKRAATNALSSVMRNGSSSIIRGLFGKHQVIRSEPPPKTSTPPPAGCLLRHLLHNPPPEAGDYTFFYAGS